MSKFKKLQELYAEKYKDLPDDEDELLRYVLDKCNVNVDKLTEEANKIDEMEWGMVEFDLPMIPMPSPRPRHTRSGHTYVEGAAEIKDYFRNYVHKTFDDKINGLIIGHDIINTRVEIYLDMYIATPTASMSKLEIALAQLKKIRPIGNGDWDNLAKTYCDMIQDILIYNDNIIVSGTVNKYYSIKPKIYITLYYQKDFDSKFNKRKILTSKSYKKLIDL